MGVEMLFVLEGLGIVNGKGLTITTTILFLKT
jgi:hypothetical protein